MPTPLMRFNGLMGLPDLVETTFSTWVHVRLQAIRGRTPHGLGTEQIDTLAITPWEKI